MKQSKEPIPPEYGTKSQQTRERLIRELKVRIWQLERLNPVIDKCRWDWTVQRINEIERKAF